MENLERILLCIRNAILLTCIDISNDNNDNNDNMNVLFKEERKVKIQHGDYQMIHYHSNII